jgi:hypothetical protein
MRRLLEPRDLLVADALVLGAHRFVGGSGSRERQPQLLRVGQAELSAHCPTSKGLDLCAQVNLRWSVGCCRSASCADPRIIARSQRTA